MTWNQPWPPVLTQPHQRPGHSLGWGQRVVSPPAPLTWFSPAISQWDNPLLSTFTKSQSTRWSIFSQNKPPGLIWKNNSWELKNLLNLTVKSSSLALCCLFSPHVHLGTWRGSFHSEDPGVSCCSQHKERPALRCPRPFTRNLSTRIWSAQSQSKFLERMRKAAVNEFKWITHNPRLSFPANQGRL